MLKRLGAVLLFVSVVLSTTGCNTARGFGEDVEHTGNAIERAVE